MGERVFDLIKARGARFNCGMTEDGAHRGL